MYLVDEDAVRNVVTTKLVLDEVSRAFVSAHLGTATSFPVLHASGTESTNSISVKSGFERQSESVGLKVGTFWPGNKQLGYPAHGSTTILLDNSNGKIRAIVSGAYLNCLRTAAAAAVSVQHLARPDSRVLSVLGAGNQGEHNIFAISHVMSIDRILISSRTRTSAQALCDRVAGLARSVEAVDAEEAVRSADVLVTATNSRAHLFESEWVRRGTHVAAIGADKKGKQELPPALFEHSLLFADNVNQSVRIGEFQHLIRDHDQVVTRIIHPIGEIIQKGPTGWRHDDDITIFDSSGIATQDLFVAEAILKKAQESGIGSQVSGF